MYEEKEPRLTAREIQELTGFTTVAWTSRVRAGDAPPPDSRFGHLQFWNESTLNKWLQANEEPTVYVEERRPRLTAAEAAGIAGLNRASWNVYVSKKIAPGPDGYINERYPFWFEKTVYDWVEHRETRRRVNRYE